MIDGTFRRGVKRCCAALPVAFSPSGCVTDAVQREDQQMDEACRCDDGLVKPERALYEARRKIRVHMMTLRARRQHTVAALQLSAPLPAPLELPVAR